MRLTSPLLPGLAAARCICTVVSAVMTWLTLWHFGSTPYPLFYGWLLNLVALTVCSSIVITGMQDTKQLLQWIWLHAGSSWAGSPAVCSCSWAPGKAAGSAADSAADSALAQQAPPKQFERSHSRWCSDGIRHIMRGLATVFRRSLLLLALLLVVIGFLLLHGGAVLADIRVLLTWFAVKAAQNTANQPMHQQQLQAAREAASQASVLLSLLFVVPSVSIKWALMIINMDFSIIPVTSAALSSVSAIAVLSTFFAGTYIHCPIWTLQQRVLGVMLVVMAVSGMFLWRLAAFCWLVFKFGGEIEAIWMWLCHLILLVNIFARSTHSRQLFQECYMQDRLMVLFLTVPGASVMVSSVVGGLGQCVAATACVIS